MAATNFLKQSCDEMKPENIKDEKWESMVIGDVIKPETVIEDSENRSKDILNDCNCNNGNNDAKINCGKCKHEATYKTDLFVHTNKSHCKINQTQHLHTDKKLREKTIWSL